MPIDNLQQKRQQALQAGYTMDEIRAYEKSRGIGSDNSNEPLHHKIINSKAIPIAGGALAGIIGSILGPAGTLAGGAAGMGAGYALQNKLQDLIGTQDEDPLEQVGNMSKDVLLDAALTVATGGVGKVPGLSQVLSKVPLGGVATRAIEGGAGSLVDDALKTITRPVGKQLTHWGRNIDPTLAKQELRSGRDLTQEFLDRGIKGDPANWAEAAASGKKTSWRQVLDEVDRYTQEIIQRTPQQTGVQPYGQFAGNAARKPGTVLNVDDLVRPMAESLHRNKTPGFTQQAGNAYKEVYEELLKMYDDGLDLKDLVELNRNINAKLWTAADNPTTSTAAKTMALDAIDKIVKRKINEFPGLAAALDQYGLYSMIGKNADSVSAKMYAAKPPSNILNVVNLPFKLLTNPTSATTMGSALYNMPSLTQYLLQRGAAPLTPFVTVGGDYE